MRPTYIRYEYIDGVGPWVWLEGETGVWDGPRMNWPDHKAMWFKHITNFRVCVQAGGALGMYSKLLSPHFKKVYTFEPDPTSYDVLTQNITDCTNIVHQNVALSDVTSSGFLNMDDKDNVGVHHITPNANHNIQMITLDSLKLAYVDFIQLDVEGHEFYVLQGAKETIERWKPVISSERGSDDVTQFLKGYGYEVMGQSHADTTYAVPKGCTCLSS